MAKAKKKKYYAVRIGRTPGIYTSWEACKDQIHGYPGAIYKSFLQREEAEAFMAGGQVAAPAIHLPSPDQEEASFLASLDEGEMVAYVDGSFNAKSKICGFGLVLLSREGRENLSGHREGDFSRHRNVAGEVFAAATAMKLARDRGMKQLTICYDYQGIASWALGDWKANHPLTQNYRRFAAEVSQDLDLYFVKVEAHTGNYYNEAADRLAKMGAGLA